MSGQTPGWLRTQYAVAASVFVWFIGTSFVIPFLPLYVQELGDTSTAETALWSGLILGSTPIVSGLFAPLWGYLADRYGKKLMLQRSLVGFTVALVMMGLAQAPWHLMAIRAGMGFFGGFMATAAALVSSDGPESEVTRGIGRVQAARVLGIAVGPLPGGFIADALGYRAACYVAGAMGGLALILVSILVQETEKAVSPGGLLKGSFGSIHLFLRDRSFQSVFATGLVVRGVERTFDPLLPLLIAQLGASSLGVASTTAMVVSVGMLATGLGSAMVGRLTPPRRRDRDIILAIVISAIIFVPIAFVSHWMQLLILRAAVGLLLGAALTLVYSVVAAETPPDRRGLALGIMGSGSNYGSAGGLVMGGALSQVTLTTVFIADAALLAGSAVFHVFGRLRAPLVKNRLANAEAAGDGPE